MDLWLKSPLLKGDGGFKGKIIFIVVLISFFGVLLQSASAAEFRVTHYYTPQEKDFEKWSTYGCESSVDCCNINNKGFYEEIRCQGSGLGNDNCLYRYHNIGRTKEASAKICEFGKEIRGITATGSNPTKKRTIAVDPSIIPLGKTVILNFGDSDCARQWNGCYIAEDTGGAVKGNHIDLYVGAGKKELMDSSCLPRYAEVEVKECNPEVGVEKEPLKIKPELDVKYSMKPSFKTSVNYDLFGKYEKYAKEAKESISKLKECLKKEIPENCKSGNIKKIEEAEKGTLIKFEAEEEPFSIFIKKKITTKFAIIVEDIVPPPKIANLKVAPGKNSAVLSWEKSNANDLNGYYVYYSKSDFSEISSAGIVAGKEAISYTLTNLDNETYYFAVAAFDEEGNYFSKVKTVAMKIE